MPTSLQTVNITYVVSGHKNTLPCTAHFALNFCQELLQIHKDHLKFVAAYDGGELLWQYRKPGPHR